MLVGAPIKRTGAKHVMEEHLAELARLADTAGVEVVGSLTQQIDRPHPGTYLGKGKVEELRDLLLDKGATLVLFDDELSPAQGKNLEDAIGVRVMDRAELILDIFATRARSSEAKMQVELAQLQYMLPRLTRMWTHLEKTRGGIVGMRGPGETQLETDRRLINHRIKVLKERLADVQRSRDVQRSARRHMFRASLVGYTNAGKSTVLRAMADANEVFVEDRLFATLDALTREVDVGGHPVLLTDTVGFIRKLPHNLVASFRATLDETREADLLLHVVDVSHPMWEEHREVVDDVLDQIGAGSVPVIHVFNKTDRLDVESLRAVQQRIQGALPGSIFVSAVEADGLEPLRRALLKAVRASRPVMEIRLPASDGRTLAELHRNTEVVDQHTEEDAIVVRARMDEATVGRLRSGGYAVTNAPVHRSI